MINSVLRKALAALAFLAMVCCQPSAPTSQLPTPSAEVVATPPAATLAVSFALATQASLPSAVATSAATSGLNPWGPFPETGLQNRPEPDPVLTPGALNPAVIQSNIASTICVAGFTTRIRPPTSYTNHLKLVQIAQYGYTDTTPGDFEEDHLISLELGGNPRDPANLWPEPHSAPLPDGTAAGSTVKDGFENYLHRSVCDGSMTLALAQTEIARDWVAGWIAAGER